MTKARAQRLGGDRGAGEEEGCLRAIEVSDSSLYALDCAPVARDWIDQTDRRFARRCLPILMANQMGWWIRFLDDVTVSWAGEPDRSSLRVSTSPEATSLVSSHFGYGIVTFSIPWLFRTSADFDLLVRGPANLPRDGASPLEGLIETSWSPATFTMNWQLTRPGVEVSFHAGDPIALIVPERRPDVESFRPRIVRLSEDELRDSGYPRWRRRRGRFLEELGGRNPSPRGWEGDYMRGDGGPPGHRRRLHLRPFSNDTEAQSTGP